MLTKLIQEEESIHKYCSNQEWGNAAFYDLCIDETKAGVDGTVDIIKKYIEIMA